ncbi:hypothetical protein AG1IA_09236 [Rhizoctonia solani AG-1 IA]|uniref:Uncharacterized protein n=1 Tax=Thanatephorus cucumeris (strain AG1-IA) TaxID=983506 RepID=L8WIU6_THACA|nr:hypothetical protein AG1IA_09236 [Rhizoctonia solani AG-1 IA]
MLCRLASDLVHTECRGTPLHAAYISSVILKGHESWFGPPTHEPDSRSGAPSPPSLLRSRGGTSRG